MTAGKGGKPSATPEPLADQRARDRIRVERDVTLVVDAGAGTGKTRELLQRLLETLLTDGVSVNRIAAITFTEKAAAEMGRRLRAGLEGAWEACPEKRPLLRGILRDLENICVTTIHSFCLRILREHAVAAALDPRFEVLDEVQAGVLEERRWEDWLGRSLQGEAPELVAALRCGMTLKQVGRTKEFLLGNLTLLGGPPPAETTAPPDALPVARAFLAAEADLRGTVLGSGIEDRLTDAASAILDLLPGLSSAGPEDLPFALFRARLAGYKDLGGKKAWGERLAAARGIVYPLREALWDFQSAFGARVLRDLERWIWGYLREAVETQSREGSLTYDGLLLRTRDLLRVRPEVLRRVRGRFDRIFIDEFQDTDPLQAEIVRLLCSREGKEGAVLDRGRLFVVGDPKQSIYRFRRADLGQYLRVRDEVRRSPGGEVESLAVNFRTVPGILEWVNGRFASLMESQAFPFAPLVPKREPGPPGAMVPVTGLRVEVPPESSRNPKEPEARAVAAEIDRLLKDPPLVQDRDGGGWRPLRAGDVAVLFRNLSSYEEAYEDAFRRLGVPFVVEGGRKFYRRPEVAALVSLLSCLAAPAEESLGVAVLRSFLFGFSDEEIFLLRSGGRVFRFLEPFEPSGPLEERLKSAFDLLARLRRQTAPLGLPEALQVLFRETDLWVVTAAQPHGAQRLANLLKVRDLAASIEEAENLTLRGFASWLRERQEGESEEEQAPGPDEAEGAVRWMTVHQAKGLEFPVVFLAGFRKRGDRSMLVDRASGSVELAFNDDALATLGIERTRAAEEAEAALEDARLLYVACTRARDGLVVPFPVPMKEEHPLAGLCEGWAAASQGASCAWRAPSGGDVRFIQPPPFPEETSDRESFSVALDGDAGPDVLEAGRALDAMEAAWMERVSRLEAGPVSRKAHAGAGGREEDPVPPSEGGAGMRFGSLVHRLMELALTRGEGLLEAAARAWGLELSLGSRSVQDALRMARRAAASGLLRRARESGRVFVEAGAARREEDGAVLEGVMDLAFVEDGAWVVVDYKTGRDPERFREEYERQLRAYAGLLKASTGMPVKEMHLLYLRSGETVPLT
jgi:ATP-dependent exoDNAse (exonuclease V) beta subunit